MVSIISPQIIMKVNLADLCVAKKVFTVAVESKTLSSMHAIWSVTRKAPPSEARLIMRVNTRTTDVLITRCFRPHYHMPRLALTYSSGCGAGVVKGLTESLWLMCSVDMCSSPFSGEVSVLSTGSAILLE